MSDEEIPTQDSGASSSDGNRVLVRLGGTCASCVKSPVTLKHYVEAKLRELVTPELVVEEVE